MANFPVPKAKPNCDPSIIGSPNLFITETDSDAAAANTAGFPSIAFPNNLKTEENFIILIEACSKSKIIYIANSSGDTLRLSDIGFQITKHWFPVFVVNIYDENTAQFKSLADYLKVHKPEDLRALIKQAPSFIAVLISQLPDNFPHALSAIKEKIMPLILNVDSAIARHYIDAISKRVKTSKKVVEEMLADLKRAQVATDKEESEAAEEEDEDDPEILAAADALAQDPTLIKHRIDTINKAGVTGERKNIALFFCALDSRLFAGSWTSRSKCDSLQDCRASGFGEKLYSHDGVVNLS